MAEVYKNDSNKSIKDCDFEVILNFPLAHCLNFTLIFWNWSAVRFTKGSYDEIQT